MPEIAQNTQLQKAFLIPKDEHTRQRSQPAEVYFKSSNQENTSLFNLVSAAQNCRESFLKIKRLKKRVSRQNSLETQEMLEEDYGHLVLSFCQENGIEVPKKNTLSRAIVLSQIDAQFKALKAYDDALKKGREELTGERIGIQGEADKNKMRREELPFLVDSMEEANPYLERRTFEGARHISASATEAVGGLFVGAAEGVFTSFDRGLESLVKNNPRVAVGLTAGALVVGSHITVTSEPLSSQAYLFLGSAVAGLAWWGSGKYFELREKDQNDIQENGF